MPHKKINTTKKTKFRVRLFTDLSSTYGRGLLQGVSKYVQEFNNWEFETTFSFFGEKIQELPPLSKHNVNGIICFTPNRKLLERVIQSGLPAIIRAQGELVPGYVNFHTDNLMLCKKAFDYFRCLGFQNFAYCGFGHLSWSKERRETFQYIAKSNGYNAHVYPTRSTKNSKKWEKEKPIIKEWLKSLPKPIGLLAGNDFRGKEVLEVCLDAQIDVPKEIAVLGVDNDDCICPFTRPPLSSIGRCFDKAGYEAASTLTSIMSGNTPKSHEITIETKGIIQRQSSDVLAIKNPTVVEAIRFIRLNADKQLTVAQVADHVAVHSRVLFNLFKTYLGYTVYDEIKRTRTDEIARLLLETDMTVAQIAQEMGFNNPDNFSRYFSQAKKMSPTDFRNHYSSFGDSAT